MTVRLSQMNWNTPIVDPQTGRPTEEFMRKWRQAVGAGAAIPSLETAANVSAVLDLLSSPAPSQGAILRRSATVWEPYASPSDATKFLNGAASPTWAQVKEADLAFTDVTTNNVSSGAHGFAPKAPGDATKFLNGAGPPAWASVKDSDISASDITTNNATSLKHGFLPKLSGTATEYLNGTGAWSTPSGGGSGSAWDFSPPSASIFSFASHDATDIALSDDSDVGLLFDAGTPIGGDNCRFAYVGLSTPANDWTLVTKIDVLSTGNNYSGFGLLAWDSVGGRHEDIIISFSGDTIMRRYGTSVSSSLAGASLTYSTVTHLPWLRFRKESGTLYWEASANGKNWYAFNSASSTAYLANDPDRVGLVAWYNRTTQSNIIGSIPYWSLTGAAV